MPTYDLSHPLASGMQTYPDDPPVSVDPHATYATDGYRVTALSLGSHTGTHVDAPSHTEADGSSLGSIPVERFRFDAQVARVEAGPREAVGVADLPEPTDAELLVLHTGWDEHWNTARYLDHPYLSTAAAEWCVEAGYHVAVDALSVDPTPSPNATDDERAGFDAHHAILGAERLVVENLRGLGRVPDRFELHAYPLSLDGDGAPVRAVGVVE